MSAFIKNHTRFVHVVVLTAFFIILLLLPSFTHADVQEQVDHHAIVKSTSSTLIQMVHSDETGLSFRLNTSPLSVAKDGSIQVNGLSNRIVEPGSPALPYYSTLIAVPPDSQVTVNVSESTVKSHSPVNVSPAPQTELWGNETGDDSTLLFTPGSIKEKSPEFVKNRSIYDFDAAFPAISYQISEPMYMRDMRMVELRLFPIRYNPLRKTVTQASQILVNVDFLNSNLAHRQAVPGYVDRQEMALRENIINYDQSRAWRSLPQSSSDSQTVKLPVGTTTYKIELDQNGIYEILGSDLAANGMNLPLDPATIQMMQGGNSVAYRFVDVNNDQLFDAGDKILFYGWAFDGSRQEKLFVNNNVYWLWAGDNASQVAQVNNEAGSGTAVSTFRESITEMKEIHFSSSWAINWDDSPNDPTSWHWHRITAPPGVTRSETFDIDLPDPDPAADYSTYLVELTTRLYPSDDPVPKYTARTFLNDSTDFGESSWSGHQNLNVKKSVAASVLKQPEEGGYPANQVKVHFSSNAPTAADVYLTRITVDYTRQLVAVNDQILFGREAAGQSDFKVSGFVNGDASKVIVWDISDPFSPKEINMQAGNITGDGSDHTYNIGRNHGTNAKFIATTSDNILPIKSLVQYVPTAIDPDNGGAKWLAISHSSLRKAADDLAAYRQPQMGAWVVNIEDIVNQIGFGFHTPETIRRYLRHALSDWATAPEYVTLFGDATRNPRHLECTPCSSWDKDTPTLIVTDFIFNDRWQGMVPSDFSMSLLIGDDLLPDIAISRIPANSLPEAEQMVQKVITYETQRQDTPQEWQKNLLFVADNSDAGGDFCVENAQIGARLPDRYNQTHLCLKAPTTEETNKLRIEMGKQVNDIGTTILNYRGHGSVNRWAGTSSSPAILTDEDTDFWQNSSRSPVILSADCLDGYFILTTNSALGETFMRLNNRGSAAHWSSAGLGFSSEHSVLHSSFYEGLFDYRLTSIGDAVNFAKVKYYQSGRYVSEMYSFILLGDAAMEVVPFEPSLLYLPAVIAP